MYRHLESCCTHLSIDCVLSTAVQLRLESKESLFKTTVKLVLETTCIKQSTALRGHCSDTTPRLKST